MQFNYVCIEYTIKSLEKKKNKIYITNMRNPHNKHQPSTIKAQIQ